MIHKEGGLMSARNRLNSVFFYGALLFAAVLGAACQSGLVFVVTLAVSLAWMLKSRHIRLDRDRPRRLPPWERR